MMADKAPNSLLEVLGKQDQERRLKEETGLPLNPDSEADRKTAEAIRKAKNLSIPVRLKPQSENGR